MTFWGKKPFFRMINTATLRLKLNSLNHKTSYDYDKFDRLIEVVDPMEKPTTYEYGDADVLSKIFGMVQNRVATLASCFHKSVNLKSRIFLIINLFRMSRFFLSTVRSTPTAQFCFAFCYPKKPVFEPCQIFLPNEATREIIYDEIFRPVGFR